MNGDYLKTLDELSTDVHNGIERLHVLKKFYFVDIDAEIIDQLNNLEKAIDEIDEFLISKGVI